MAAPFGGMGGVADPRIDGKDIDAIGTRHDSIIHSYGPPDTHGHSTIYVDSSISFENYRWWAQRAREYEKTIPANAGITGFFQVFLGSKKEKPTQLPADATGAESTGEKKSDPDREQSSEKTGLGGADDAGAFVAGPTKTNTTDKYGVTEEEWETAQRAARTASWGAIFYLITTDILGPYSIPFAISVRVHQYFLVS